jgi:hypothetical protein
MCHDDVEEIGGDQAIDPGERNVAAEGDEEEFTPLGEV